MEDLQKEFEQLEFISTLLIAGNNTTNEMPSSVVDDFREVLWKWITKNFLSGYEVQRLIALEGFKAVSQELDKVASHCPICEDGGLFQNEEKAVIKCDCIKVVNSRFNIRKILMNLQIEAFKKTGEPKKHQIEVSVEGGGVVAVDNIPADVVVEVRDFDDDDDIPKTKLIDYEQAKKDHTGSWYSWKHFERS